MADDLEVLERGDIFFFYRPRVEDDDPSGLGDVQHAGFVLRPRGGGKVRLMMLGRKTLPDLSGDGRDWGFVETVAKSASEIEAGLRETTYETKTRGTREQPAARPAGEGRYAVILKEGQLHLVHALEMPEEPGPVQKALKIAPEAAYALSIKNPEKASPKGAGLPADEEADYPKRLQEAFRGRRFDTEDLKLLDHEGAEFLLVGARSDPLKAYGLSLETEAANYEHADSTRKMKMAKTRHPIEPLFEGTWA
ncbi:hypothetical protein [Pseudoroseicyclus aestuarii]|uniref:Uncharacterized protein n=1 Tax=Pseudoroseicyclus aestuarii TaxID=1795041 RepID=A0A318SS75_9RHOB|nr:hypothetical protein [Pseudoroseicyclus aestuarii]PYE81216.1 hypothetical protein DFP88_1075 [Pseudoroseicyclus aestuarii]